jgi:hypothetical protein
MGDRQRPFSDTARGTDGSQGSQSANRDDSRSTMGDDSMMIGRDRKAFKNTSGLDSGVLRRILAFVMPRNVDRKILTVWVKKTRSGVAGRYYGFRQHPHIVARVGVKQFPMTLRLYQYAQHKGRRHWLASREEAAVYVLAHETRHFWQQHSRLRNCPFPEGRGRVSSRGVFSEVDTEAYAIHKLREWRRQAN